MEWVPKYSRYTSRPRRGIPSKPLRVLLDKGLIPPGAKILDLGCGREGADVLTLRELGYDAYGYDPYWPPWDDDGVLTKNTYDIVLNFYVLNVLPPEDRVGVLKTAWRVLKPWGKLYVAVRDVSESKRPIGTPYKDGILLKKGGVTVFQKWYTLEEIIEEIMGRKKGFEKIEGFFAVTNVVSRRQPLLVEAEKVYPK